MKINFSQLLEIVRMGWNSLKNHRFRTFLTMLGVSIGIFAITVIFTLVFSLHQKISKNLSELGNKVVFVHNWPWKDNGDDWYKFINRPQVSFNEFKRLKKNLNDVEGVSFETTGGASSATYKGKQLSGPVLKSVAGDYFVINTFKIEKGRAFSEFESGKGKAVCIIGANIAKEFFEGNWGVGQQINVGGNKVKVVGIVEREGNNMFGTSKDDMIIIPYAYAAKRLKLTSRSIDKLVAVKARDHENLPWVENQIIGQMRTARSLKAGWDDNFSLNKQEMLMNQLEGVFKYLRISGIIISIFSIIVGGFGIGNIMYTSVKERTFEIGLQKSLGANRAFILLQFLFESVLVCLFGGIIGLFLLFIAGRGLEAMLTVLGFPMEIIITNENLGFGVILSAVIGLTSGFVPSIFASSLNPVEAMRG